MKRTCRVGKVAALVACLVCVLLLAGCGGNSGDELAVRDVVTSTLEAYEADDVASGAQDLLGETTRSELAEYGIDADEYLSRCLANYSFEVGDVTVDGDTATVEVSVTNLDLDAAMSAATSRFEAYVDTDEAETTYEEGGERELMVKLFDYLFEAMESSADLVTNTVEVTCAKDEAGVWACSLGDNPALVKAILGQSAA